MRNPFRLSRLLWGPKGRSAQLVHSPSTTEQVDAVRLDVVGTLPGRREMAQAVYVAAGKIRHTVEAKPVTDQIFDLPGGRVYTVVTSSEQYYDNSFAELQLQNHEDDATRRRRNREWFNDAERSMGPLSEPILTKAEPETVAGLNCERYLVSMGPLLRVDLSVSLGFHEPFPELTTLLRWRSDPSDPLEMRLEHMIANVVLRTGGLPLRTRVECALFGQDLTITRRVAKVTRDSFPGETFLVPTGYRRRRGLPPPGMRGTYSFRA